MNYFTHGRNYLKDPYFLAGTAVPDWLSVVDRRVRARSKLALPHISAEDPRLAKIAQGIVRHHYDDGWFHQTPAFLKLNWEFTVRIREILGENDGFRPSFVGHILVEILLDESLFAEALDDLECYYAAIDAVDPGFVEFAVNLMANRPTDKLAILIPRFSSARFLYDYTDDAKLLGRLNMVMNRVRLPTLPAYLADFFPLARQLVRLHQRELLTEPAPGDTT